MSAPRRPPSPCSGAEPDGGFAMLTVVAAMFVLTVFSLTALTVAANGLPQSRRAQDTAGAVAAAQAGLDDLLSRLNVCDTYWADPNSCSPGTPDVNPALFGAERGEWALVDDPRSGTTAPGALAAFRYRYLSVPESTSGSVARGIPATVGLIRLESTGQVNGVTRTLTADLRKAGFLRYIYYTDFEAHDPALVAAYHPRRKFDSYRWRKEDGTTGLVYNIEFEGLPESEALKCGQYHYTGRPASLPEKYSYPVSGGTFTSTINRSCDIQFTSTDRLRGPLHTNDAILLEGGATFEDPTTHSSWPAGSTPAPTPGSWFRGVSGGQPNAAGHRPVYGPAVTMPPTGASATREAALRDGCLYTGPTSIEFLSTGQLRVHSPRSGTLRAGCGPSGGIATPQVVDGPRNGVVHVQSLGEDDATRSVVCAAGEKVLGLYPETGDVTRYDCRRGDVFVRGEVGRPLTVSASGNVIVTGNTTYANEKSVLGLIARNNVEVYHPVRCLDTPNPGSSCPPDRFTELASAPKNVRIDAAILSLEHSFTVQNFDRGGELGTLTVNGGIYQRFRGPVASATPMQTLTGFPTKAYAYDKRLLSLPPPSFLEPKVSAWQVVALSEQDR